MSAPANLGLSRFQLVRELGSGATGTVHEAVLARPLGKLRPGTRVAVKFLHQTQTSDPAARKRFLREAKLGLAVRHENLVRVYAVEEENLLGQSFLYLVMEYIEGETLRELLGQGGPLAEALVRSIARQVAAALAALHGEGIVHFDVKPENVVLTKDGRVVLMDLGFARNLKSQSESEELSSFQGSVAYAAPERIRGGARPDPRSDLYALGVMLHELATGQLPFPHEDISALLHAQLEETPPPPSKKNPRVSAFLDALVAKLLAKDPAERLHHAKDVASILEEGERSPWWRKRVETERAMPSFHLRHRIPLGGRKRELEALEKEWKRARRGKLRFLAIEGEEGLGKSRLVDEFAAKLREGHSPPLTLYGRSQKMEQPVPFAPLQAAMERFLGLNRQAKPGTVEEKRLRKLVGTEDAKRILDTNRAGGEEALAASFARLFEAIAREGSTVLFLDDFSFVDRGTLLALAKLAEKEDCSLFVLFAVRPSQISEEASAFLRRLEEGEQLARLTLKTLTSAELRESLQRLLAPQAPLEDWAQALEERGASNPGLLAEILRVLRDRGNFEELGEGNGFRWLPKVSPREVPIPESAAEAIRARQELLDPEERALLECAAVAGTRFEASRLASAFDLDALKTLQILSQIERRYGLLVSAGPEFRFARPVVRDILYRELSEETRRDAHRRLALQMEREAGKASLPQREALLLADHAAKSADPAIALRVLPPLIVRLQAGGYFEQVRRLAKAALEQLARAGATTAGAGYPVSAGAASIATDPAMRKRRFDLLLLAAEAESRLGRRDEEKRDLEECAHIASELNDDARRTATFFHLGRYAFNTGKYLVALRFFERAEQLHEKRKDAAGLAESRLQRANALSYLGERTEAETIFASLLREARVASLRVRAGLGLGRILAERGERSGIKTLETALSQARKLKDPVLESLACLYLGRAKRSLPLLEKGIALAQLTGDRRTLCLLEIEKARLLTKDRKQRKTAEALLERALTSAREIQDSFAISTALLGLAELKKAVEAPAAQRQQAARQALLAAENADLEELQIQARELL